jgi:hypothetical protein
MTLMSIGAVLSSRWTDCPDMPPARTIRSTPSRDGLGLSDVA